MEIILYYAPNTCALAPYVTLTEAGVAFEVRPLNFRKNQQNSPSYLQIIRSTRYLCSLSMANL
jgi:glutathione S-transferase